MRLIGGLVTRILVSRGQALGEVPCSLLVPEGPVTWDCCSTNRIIYFWQLSYFPLFTPVNLTAKNILEPQLEKTLAKKLRASAARKKKKRTSLNACLSPSWISWLSGARRKTSRLACSSGES